MFVFLLANERASFHSRAQDLLEHLLLRNEANRLSLYNEEQMMQDINFTLENVCSILELTIPIRTFLSIISSLI